MGVEQADRRPNSPATIIRTKLYIPQVQPNWVRRPRLVRRITEGTSAPLTLVSAPAGFGKTSLLGEWVAASVQQGPNGRVERISPIPVAWISLEKRDDDLDHFMVYVLAALATLEIDFGKTIFQQMSSTISTEDALTSLVNQLAEARSHFALVLEDLHNLTT